MEQGCKIKNAMRFRFASFRDHVLLHIPLHNKPKHCNSFRANHSKGRFDVYQLWPSRYGSLVESPGQRRQQKWRSTLSAPEIPVRNSQITIFCCKQHGRIKKVGHVPQSSYFKTWHRRILFITSSFPRLKRFPSRCPATNFESNTPLRSRSSKKLTKFPMAQSFQAHEPTRHCTAVFLRLSK